MDDDEKQRSKEFKINVIIWIALSLIFLFVVYQIVYGLQFSTKKH
jgi:hypothetical protein